MTTQTHTIKPGKGTAIAYWSLTGLVSLGFLMSSFMYLGKNPELVQNFQKIGYPLHFVTILGLAKLLGSVALVNPWFPKLREWAYAGFAFTLIGATWVHVATATPFVAPLIFLVLLMASYFFNRKREVAGA